MGVITKRIALHETFVVTLVTRSKFHQDHNYASNLSMITNMFSHVLASSSSHAAIQKSLTHSGERFTCYGEDIPVRNGFATLRNGSSSTSTSSSANTLADTTSANKKTTTTIQWRIHRPVIQHGKDKETGQIGKVREADAKRRLLEYVETYAYEKESLQFESPPEDFTCSSSAVASTPSFVSYYNGYEDNNEEWVLLPVVMEGEQVDVLLSVMNGKSQNIDIKEVARTITYKCSSPSCRNEGLKSCGRCLTAKYCSAECQRSHWKGGHKLVCVVAGSAPKPKTNTAPSAAAPSKQPSILDIRATAERCNAINDKVHTRAEKLLKSNILAIPCEEKGASTFVDLLRITAAVPRWSGGAWPTFFSQVYPKAFPSIPASFDDASELVNTDIRAMTDILTQPLTALFAIIRAGVVTSSSSTDPVNIHIVGAENDYQTVELGGRVFENKGAEMYGGMSKWLLLQRLLPCDIDVNILYVGPGVTRHGKKAVRPPSELPHPRRGTVTLEARKGYYHDVVDVATERPTLVLAQNAGIQHGPHTREWLPTLRALCDDHVLFCATMYDLGEHERSIRVLNSCNVSLGKVIFSGRSPVPSMNLGNLETEADIFSWNRAMLLVQW